MKNVKCYKKDYPRPQFVRDNWMNLNGKWNFINTNGELISNQWFDYIYNFFDGFSKVELNGKDYKIDTDGKLYNLNENKKIISVEKNNVYTTYEKSYNSWGINKMGINK